MAAASDEQMHTFETITLPTVISVSLFLSLPLIWSLMNPRPQLQYIAGSHGKAYHGMNRNFNLGGQQNSSSWEDLVGFRQWHGTERDDPDACSVKMKSFMPKQDGPFQFCYGDTNGFNILEGPWAQLLDKELNTYCVYHSQHTQKQKLLTLPSPEASVYFVFVTSTILSFRPVDDIPGGALENNEWPALKASRWFHLNWTLSRLREQFGERIEITLVAMDGEEPQEGLHISPGVVNTVVWNVMDDGQDWKLYQVGLQEAWHRLHRFSWVFVGNDQMVGPNSHFPSVIEHLEKVNAGSWFNSAAQGFLLGFSKALVAENRWRLYWSRARWPCATYVHMLMGESLIFKPPLSFQDSKSGAWCQSNHQFGKGAPLTAQKSYAPHFWYRWGLEQMFLPNACYNRPCKGGDDKTESRESALKKLEASRAWLEAEENSNAPDSAVQCNLKPRRFLQEDPGDWQEFGSGIDI
jgi:hypothetical protein